MPRKKPGKGAAASKKATPIKTAPDTSPLALATIYQPRVHDWSYSQVQGNAVPRNFAVTSYQTVRTFVDPPGNLSPNGPRHDNDKASIEEIAILPTTSEIQANRAEYLPPKGKGFPHHESGIHRLLDSQFRLLREDTAGQLRDAVRGLVEHWEVLVCGNDLNAKRKCVQQIGCEMKILDWVKVVRVRGKRMVIDVSFAQPDIVSRMTQYQRMNWWSDSRDLETGNLVALVDDVLGTTFLLVKDRVVVKPMGESQGQDYDFPSWGFDQEADSLAGDADRAMLSFTLATPTSVIDKERIIALSRQTTFGTAVLVQFPGILYAAFEPFLNRLKSLHKQPILPLQKWIVPTAGTHYATKNGFIEVPPSPYLRLVDLDLSCITTNRYPLIFSTNNPVTVKQLVQHTTLDRGQCESFIMSLMRELALVQGPPGTGKSFVGHKLVQVLLDNRDRLNLGPIICVCYTNHALDQFLGKLIDSGETNIVRMGYGTKSERMKNFELSGRRTTMVPLDTTNGYPKAQHQEPDARRLVQAHVIGATTTGLAAYSSRIQKLCPKVLLCEEAGEVLEAHLITALLPSIEHAILIGDHEQLRPHISNHALSIESKKHEKYDLDVSLFERLVNEEFNGAKMPFAKLYIQRRMHPSIASLVRGTLYPTLHDDSTTYTYPEVAGMRRRLFWLDHRNCEGSGGSMETSKSNEYEAQMVLSLVRHLAQQGVYSRRHDIAILTPYLGQREKLCGMLGTEFDIIEGDQHVDDIENEMPLFEKQPVRVATVDSFQGEEAKIVIVSLVRSNNEQRCGFLKTSNRINVLLSRARHGMYIIGDSETARVVPMWASIIRMLEEKGNIGRTLELQCPRHPDISIPISTPRDFAWLAPNGGCLKRCKDLLTCGHVCPMRCHSDQQHESAMCEEACMRRHYHCGHRCPQRCSEDCGNCQVIIPSVLLPCGHRASKIQCHEAMDPTKIKCNEACMRQHSHCGHLCPQRCWEDCGNCQVRIPSVTLPCGHTARNLQCHETIDLTRMKCNEACMRWHYHCGHRCPQRCWADCGSCKVTVYSVELPCGHTALNLQCHETIDLAEIICRQEICGQLLSYGNMVNIQPSSASFTWAEDVEREFGMLTIR